VLPMVEAYEWIARGSAPIILGDGTEVHDYVYAGDVARANLLAMRAAAARETFIIASGIPTSFNEQVSLVLRVWGSDLKPERRTATRLRSAGATAERFSGEKAKVILGWTGGERGRRGRARRRRKTPAWQCRMSHASVIAGSRVVWATAMNTVWPGGGGRRAHS
jgi:hypothetical protein